MTEKKPSIERLIYFVFGRSQIQRTQKCKHEFIPWEQGALLNKVNQYRTKQFKMEPIDNNAICRALSKLKSQGKVEKLRWFNPSEGNIWIWIGND